jgi:MFS family permease
VLVIVSPIAGLFADSLGFGQALGSAVVIFAVSAMVLALSPFRRARVS